MIKSGRYLLPQRKPYSRLKQSRYGHSSLPLCGRNTEYSYTKCDEKVFLNLFNTSIPSWQNSLPLLILIEGHITDEKDTPVSTSLEYW